MRKKTGYQDIKATVLERIHANIWPAGTAMPGEIELAEEFQCARATVNRAMRELVEEGIIERKRKSGTRVKAAPTRQAKFVMPLIRAEIEKSGAAYRYTLVHQERLATPDWLQGRLGLPPDTDVLHLHCMHYADGRPFQFENRWISLDTVPAAVDADFSTMGPNEWLVKLVPFTEVELTFSASAASQKTADLLSVAKDTPLFTAERTTWLRSLPVTFAQFYFHAGYQMTARL
ncbi:MAG: GntR family transcriptional regulator [Albidovulum sp.]